MSKTILNFSGSSTKIIHFVDPGTRAIKQFNPHIVTGVSGGALIMMPLLLGKSKDLVKILTSLKPSDFMTTPFQTDKGNLNLHFFYVILQNIIGPLFGFKPRDGFTTMKPAKNLLRKFVSKEEFLYLKSKYELYVGITSLSTSSEHAVKLNLLDYEHALDMIIASASIPVATVTPFSQSSFYDGGVLSHIFSTPVMMNYDIDTCISIYSIPEELSATVVRNTGLLNNLYRTYKMIMHHSSQNDQYNELNYCSTKNIDLYTCHANEHTKGLYDTSDENLNNLYRASLKAKFIHKNVKT